MDTEQAKPQRIVTAQDIALGKESAKFLCNMADMGAVALISDRAKMTVEERGSIEPPLAKLIAKSTPEQAAKFHDIMDPCMLAMGLCFWIGRIMREPKVRNGQTEISVPMEERIAADNIDRPTQTTMANTDSIVAAPPSIIRDAVASNNGGI